MSRTNFSLKKLKKEASISSSDTFYIVKYYMNNGRCPLFFKMIFRINVKRNYAEAMNIEEYLETDKVNQEIRCP